MLVLAVLSRLIAGYMLYSGDTVQAGLSVLNAIIAAPTAGWMTCRVPEGPQFLSARRVSGHMRYGLIAVWGWFAFCLLLGLSLFFSGDVFYGVVALTSSVPPVLGYRDLVASETDR